MPPPPGPALPILAEPPFDPGDEVPTVLITGAGGNIGQKLRRAWADRYDLILLDCATGGDPDIVACDLSTWNPSWSALFEEADAVVHLAALPDEHSAWPELVGPNLDMLGHVFHAAALAGVGRLVFASSNHAMGEYRQLGADPIAEHLPQRPGNPYGATKLFGERLGFSLSQAFGIEFVALRLGWIQRGENRPETLPDAWARDLWLADDDLVELFRCALETELPTPAVIINGVSDNPGTRWPMGQARDVLGFVPVRRDPKPPGEHGLQQMG